MIDQFNTHSAHIIVFRLRGCQTPWASSWTEISNEYSCGEQLRFQLLTSLQKISEHSIIVSNTCLSPVVPSIKKTPFLLLQLTPTIEYLTNPPSC